MIKDPYPLKVIDVALQSILIICFGYFIDPKYNYKTVIAILVVEQMLSVILHFFMDFKGKMQVQRILFAISISIFTAVYFYVVRDYKESFFAGALGNKKLDIPMHQVELMTVGMSLCFWYSILCFTEVKYIYKRVSKRSRMRR